MLPASTIAIIDDKKESKTSKLPIPDDKKETSASLLPKPKFIDPAELNAAIALGVKRLKKVNVETKALPPKPKPKSAADIIIEKVKSRRKGVAGDEDDDWNDALKSQGVDPNVKKQKKSINPLEPQGLLSTVTGQENAKNDALEQYSPLPVAKPVDEELISVDNAKSARDKMAETKVDMINKLENMDDKKFKKKLNDPKFKARVKGILNNFGKNMGNIKKRETLIQTMRNI